MVEVLASLSDVCPLHTSHCQFLTGFMSLGFYTDYTTFSEMHILHFSMNHFLCLRNCENSIVSIIFQSYFEKKKNTRRQDVLLCMGSVTQLDCLIKIIVHLLKVMEVPKLQHCKNPT